LKMPEDPALTEMLIAAATSIGAKAVPGPPELAGGHFNSEVLSDAISGRSLMRHSADLPTRVASARIDDIPVLIGELVGAPARQAIDPQLRRYRNQAMIARSWLASDAPNLQLFLIWPVGEYLNANWRQYAAEIEADDRACRKLVWLLDSDPTEQSARQFLARTFVARPWPHASQQVLLDAMATYELPPGWEEAIDDNESDYDSLVAKLISLEGQGA
jgi:hypothetical protein